MIQNLYTPLCKYAYLPVLDWAKKTPHRDAFKEATSNQYISSDELESLRISKLQKILTHAYIHVPFYKTRMDSHNINPHKIQTINELKNLPLLEKQDVFTLGDELYTQNPRGRATLATTSGSTGIATRFYHDSYHFGWAWACVWRGRSWWDVARSDRQVTLWGRPLEGSFIQKKMVEAKYLLRNNHHVSTFDDYNEGALAAVVHTIKKVRPRLIYGYGSSLGKLAQYLADHKIYLSANERPKLIEYTADHMYENEIALLSRHTGAPVLSQYGASETPGLAQQCWAGSAHISADHAIVEFLRPDGSDANPGELAEIVVTPLHEFAMPLLRYRVGDMGSYEEGACRCGVTLPKMQLKIGKAVDLIATSTRSGVSAHVLDYINIYLMKHNIRGVKQFFVEQDNLDHFQLRIVAESASSSEHIRAAEVFVAKMREYLGEQIDVNITFVNEIPLQASGKRRYFKQTYKV